MGSGAGADRAARQWTRRCTAASRCNGDAGYHEVSWDGVREDGRSAAFGVYFAVLDVEGEQVDVAKLVLLR